MHPCYIKRILYIVMKLVEYYFGLGSQYLSHQLHMSWLLLQEGKQQWQTGVCVWPQVLGGQEGARLRQDEPHRTLVAHGDLDPCLTLTLTTCFGRPREPGFDKMNLTNFDSDLDPCLTFTSSDLDLTWAWPNPTFNMLTFVLQDEP